MNVDAVLVARNQEAMEAARRKMQEELDAKAVLFREKQKQVLKFFSKKTMWPGCVILAELTLCLLHIHSKKKRGGGRK